MTMPLFGQDDPAWEIVEVLRGVNGWPADEADVCWARTLITEYPRLDILVEARAWRDWMRDFHGQRRTKHHARFSNWLRNATRGRSERRRTGGARVGGSPIRAEVGRESSTRLEQW